MEHAISPNYRTSDFPGTMSIDQKIDVFSDRVDGWQLGIAQQCIDSIPHSGFAVLHIIFSYFEMISQYQDGTTSHNQSYRSFSKGFMNVFPDINTPSIDVRERILKKMYKDVRCGLYHSGLTGENIELSGDFNFVIAFTSPPDKIQINPHKLVPELQRHFKSYVDKLRDPVNQQLRDNFNTRFGINL